MNLVHNTHYRIYKKELSQNIKIVIISDIHFSYQVKDTKLTKLLTVISNIQPNYIFIPGDIIDSNDMIKDKNERQRFITWLTKLSNTTKVIMAFGNHDDYHISENKNFEKYNYYKDKPFWHQVSSINNVYLLDNSAYSDDFIHVVGLTLPFSYYRYKNTKQENIDVLLNHLKQHQSLLTNLPQGKLTYALIHSPVHLTNDKVTSYLQKFDYLISGHMHNGCVPPIIYELWTSDRGFIAPNKQPFPHNERNTLKTKDDKLLVNGPITTFQACSGYFHLANFLFPMYISTLEFTTNKQNDNDKLNIERKYL